MEWGNQQLPEREESQENIVEDRIAWDSLIRNCPFSAGMRKTPITS